MSVQQGRIGGPLLANNLLRNGSNLAFDNKVLFIDVVNKRIGFNTNSPVNDLYTPTAIDTTNLIVDNTADVGNWVFTGSTIQQVLTSITISPNQAVNPSIVTPGLSTANLYLYGNNVTDTVTNDSINFTPKDLGGQILSVVINVDPAVIVGQTLTVVQGTATGGAVSFGIGIAGESGTVVAAGFGYVAGAAQAKDSSNNLYSITITTTALTSINFANGNGNVQVTVNAGLHAQGNITFDGGVVLGDAATDTITFAAEINSNLLPSANNTYNLGNNTTPLVWNNVYAVTDTATTLAATTSTVTTLNAGNIQFNSNTITDATADITFGLSGTGALKFNSAYYFSTANTITFPSATVTFNNTGNGYIQFTGNNGVVFPAGTSSNYPATPVQGQVRYNSTLGYSEVYNGTSWSPVGGTSAVLTQSQVNDTMWAWDLILG